LKNNKIKIAVFTVILALIFFGTSTVFSSCSLFRGAAGETVAGSTTASATTDEEDTDAETTAAETTGSTAPETTAPDTTAPPETTAAETTAAPTTETTPATTVPPETAPKPVAPTIKLKIYEGPTYSPGDDICYYRVEAVVTGTPKPTVTFSKDDSNGSWGKLKAQINVTRTNPNYTITATVKNSAGTDTDSIDLSWGCGPLIIEKTAEFKPSDLASVDSAGTITNGSVVFGDNAADKDIRGFFAFDISSLKGKNLISATLQLAEPNITETINFKDKIQIWYVDFLSGGVTASDYMDTPYSGPQSFKWNVDPLTFSTDFLKTIISDRAAAERKLEFGIWFANPATGGTSGIDEKRIYHTNDITLTVTYEQ
jgi:hypothetical protein